jgi:hypothetical protein
MGKKAPCKDKKCFARGVYFLKKTNESIYIFLNFNVFPRPPIIEISKLVAV